MTFGSSRRNSFALSVLKCLGWLKAKMEVEECKWEGKCLVAVAADGRCQYVKASSGRDRVRVRGMEITYMSFL